jgi:hypothetical protein
MLIEPSLDAYQFSLAMSSFLARSGSHHLILADLHRHRGLRGLQISHTAFPRCDAKSTKSRPARTGRTATSMSIRTPTGRRRPESRNSEPKLGQRGHRSYQIPIRLSGLLITQNNEPHTDNSINKTTLDTIHALTILFTIYIRTNHIQNRPTDTTSIH